MIKKIIITFITIVMIGLIILNCFARVFTIAKYKNVTGFIPVLLILLLVTGIIIFFVKKSSIVINVSLILLILLITSNFISAEIIRYEYKKVFENGEKIGVALEKYHTENQYYPHELTDLIPTYIDDIPKDNTTWSHSDSNSGFMYYVVDKGNDYVLSYGPYTYDKNGWYHEP